MSYAIDLFCGAGGFSEGILQAGFDIVFSSDKSPMVQKTYMNRHEQLGLLQGRDTHFELADIKELSSEFIFEKINSLKYGDIFSPGKIDVMFGGPPCQGFSRLGKRDSNDPRNMLFHEYLRIIKDIDPKYVVMENVTGILDMQMLDFPSVLEEGRIYSGQNLVPFILRTELEGLGYQVLDIQVLNAANYGVPQQRNRAIFLAYRNGVYPISYPDPQESIVTVYDALGDLYESCNYSTHYSKESTGGRTPNVTTEIPVKKTKITNMETSNHDKSVIQRFSLYKQGENRKRALTRLREEGINLLEEAPELFYETLYQVNSEQNAEFIQKTLEKYDFHKSINITKLWLNNTNKQLSLISMIENKHIIDINFDAAISSLSRRLKTTIENTIEFWNNVQHELNKQYDAETLNNLFISGNISDLMADALFTKKGIRTRLNSESIAPTMVTLPDDYIHPFFNRILTVREMARLQSFDDSFEFLGKRTTGGSMRAKETPQFTQVGNAVPPLLAKAIATEAMKAIKLGEKQSYIDKKEKQ
ncbi:DNA (cytosine-5-)-methyltransferase [Bacillus anthracis]|nr:DNA (cytosine-5-)-methyltransferase [Bacillus anthracis]PGT36881.1 DNA (cytosine-5-)-methyltransferase [Bacillus anthracis]PGZ28717.1 DNA (cytosine-5-)-methyltransferase [Bacillus anthracis]